ncbi:MAG: trigger factor [Gemmatimonadaceae bacterium]|nr:trigger factor [Gemmatimonadaceae bacterium]MDQ3244485.1 trigger factor [Gemmatimonadota bacterium]
MNIEITPKESSGVDRHVQITVPAETVRDAEDKAARRYASSVRLPGFRPGKAPPMMVRKKFADAIRQEALEALVRDAYKEVVEKQDLKVASQPHVHDLKFEEGKPLTFELHFELRPTLELARISGFRVTKRAVTVTSDSVQEQLEAIRDQRAAWAPVEEKPMPADMVNVEISTGDDSSEAKSYPLVLGTGQAIPGIEELVMEASPGETVERLVRWPDDFPDEAQRGQAKLVRIKLHDVKRKSAPPLDDAFAREVGDFESLDALKAAIRADLTESSTREADAEVRQKLVDEIIGANSFDVPKSWVQQFAANYAEAYQIPEEDREKFATEFQSMAERQIRRDLVLETIAEREGLGSTEKDIDDRITAQAEKRGLNPGQLYAQLEKNGRLKEIERSLTEDKVFQWLMERNEVQTES